MKLFERRATQTERANFSMLRARLEVEVARPAVIAITSSTAKDGNEIAARELACSLAATGYTTLFVDTSLASRNPGVPPQGLALEEIGRRQATPDSRAGNLAALTLSDAALQKATNQRGVQSTLEILRSKFDYVVINAESGVMTSFATSVVTAADAVIVSVRTGRRQTAGDARLAETLERVGSRFIGVVALDPSVIDDDRAGNPVPDAIFNGFRGQTIHGDQERQRRGIAESPT